MCTVSLNVSCAVKQTEQNNRHSFQTVNLRGGGGFLFIAENSGRARGRQSKPERKTRGNIGGGGEEKEELERRGGAVAGSDSTVNTSTDLLDAFNHKEVGYPVTETRRRAKSL